MRGDYNENARLCAEGMNQRNLHGGTEQDRTCCGRLLPVNCCTCVIYVLYLDGYLPSLRYCSTHRG